MIKAIVGIKINYHLLTSIYVTSIVGIKINYHLLTSILLE